MRVGTPGFIGDRLIEGREARGLSQTSLAELTGLKSQSISHYEQGRQSPSPEALQHLCDHLDLPARYFLRPLPRTPRGPVFFRASSSVSRLARLKAERTLDWMHELSEWILQHVDLPDAALPEFPVDPNCAGYEDEIERIATELRAALHLGQGPIGELTSVLEESGCAVAILPMEPELGGSYSHFHEDMSTIMLSREETRPSWARFHLAHELGHLVMHRQTPSGVFAVAQADRFARAFLMPARVFGQEVWAQNIDALLTLKKDWRCPISVMATRCGEIDVFTPDQVRRAMVNLGRRGWKTAEPRENALTLEQPQLLARSLRLVIDESLKTPHAVLAELALGAADIETLAGLPAGYFAGCEKTSPATLRLRRNDTGEGIRVG